MAETRSEQFAVEFEAVQDEFIHLIDSLTDQQWNLIGKNHPKRMNDEDEGRPVGVIAHHVAITGDFIIDRIQRMLEERPLPQVDFREINQKHASEHEEVTRAEVLRILRESKPRLAAAVRAIPDEQLDQPRQTPVGPMSISQRLEMVLIGHIQGHKGSILAAVLQG
jgi:hypothetical protein